MFLFSQIAFSYVPTAESLFRFAGLMKDESNYKSMVFTIDGDNKADPRLYRLSFHQDQRYASKPMYLSQMMYQGLNVKDEALLNLKQFNAFSVKTFGEKSREVVPVFFYTLLQGMLYHNGKFVLDALRNFQFNLSYNRELKNQDYARLLREYKVYVTKEKEGAEEPGISPLSPTNAQDRIRLKETLKKGLIGQSNQVKREYENGKFAFYIREGSFEAKFEEDSRELRWIKFMFEDQKYEITFDDYLAFKGKYYFPQTITFITPKNIIKMKTRNIWAREESWSAFARRKSEEATQNANLQAKEPFPPMLL